MSEYTYTRPMPAHRFIERHLINLMIDELRAAGWLPYEFDNGDDLVPIVVIKGAPNWVLQNDVWAEFDAVDDGFLYVAQRSDDASGWIRLIGGNGPDVISDYSVNLEPIMQKVFLR